MLEQMGEAVGARILMPGAAIDVETDRDRLDPGHRLGGDGEAIGQAVDVRTGHRDQATAADCSATKFSIAPISAGRTA